ncbi:hypothetical protein HPB50_004829 [Hyalomma asiaticum]|uniref:Uncharacterized protein n=1 Tax=Hyalomma asiaticum TaxID=266040 RepID=A0ACB7SKN4_HYAAI|nr:hypothetical protein HPB50_004829 [Hyalomma asiaticum]
MAWLEHCGRSSAASLFPLITAGLFLATAVSCAAGGVRPSTLPSTSASGTKKTEIWQIDLLPDNGGGHGGGGNGGGFGPVAPPHSPPPVIHHHHHQANDRGSVGGGVHHGGNVGLHAFPTAGGGESYEQQIPLHAIVHTPMQVDTTSRWPSSSDCAMTNKDMSAAAPLVALFVGLALALPMLGLLFIAKMHLLSALTGGSSVPQTVTTSVGGRKDDVLERRLAEAWPAFRDAVRKYVLDGRSVGTTKNMTAHSM